MRDLQLEAVGDQYGFDGKGRYAHAGMLKAALGIRAELERNDVLGRIFSGNDSTLKTPLRDVRTVSTFTRRCVCIVLILIHSTLMLQNASCTHYKLVVTGHSLGAGSAVLLAIILRSSFPTLHCYAFGTPGSVLDKRSCKGIVAVCP